MRRSAIANADAMRRRSSILGRLYGLDPDEIRPGMTMEEIVALRKANPGGGPHSTLRNVWVCAGDAAIAAVVVWTV